MPGDETEIRPLWDKRARERYTDMLTKVRKKQRKPKWLLSSWYASFCASWQSESFRKRSETNRRNRMANPALHTGGSICHAEHSRRLVMSYKLQYQ